MKNFFKVVFSRAVFTGVFIALQFAAIFLAVTRFNEHFALFYGICLVLSAIVVIYLVGRDGNPAYKIAWIIPILALPVFGVLLYLVFGKNQLSPKEKARMSSVSEQYEKAMRSVTAAEPALPEHTDAKRVSDYIHRVAATPVFTHTETTYLPVGEAYLKALLAELEKAEKFIFMEYYIIAPGQMWDAIHDVLRRKAKDGVDVRVMYDDFGCMYKLPEGYENTLKAEGIRCCVFNRFVPVLSPRFNNRDHRKICVIDGNVGFTGGINFSDAYINVVQRCGHWLDAGVMLRGGGVYALTAMFLSMWDYTCGVTEDFTRYAPDTALCDSISAPGWVQPFGDTPLDNEPVGETVYLHLINRAKDYVYINTPYLIIDNEMVTALTAAAKSGVDVRIVTPAISDSALVHEMTRSYYETLILAGVKIYEYTPGMVHAKTFISDDCSAVVGTINLDYRSLFLHFECGVWMYETNAVADMKAEYLSELEKSQQITQERCLQQRRGRRIIRAVLRTLAPLF